jgi:hypothetical protein
MAIYNNGSNELNALSHVELKGAQAGERTSFA